MDSNSYQTFDACKPASTTFSLNGTFPWCEVSEWDWGVLKAVLGGEVPEGVEETHIWWRNTCIHKYNTRHAVLIHKPVSVSAINPPRSKEYACKLGIAGGQGPFGSGGRLSLCLCSSHWLMCWSLILLIGYSVSIDIMNGMFFCVNCQVRGLGPAIPATARPFVSSATGNSILKPTNVHALI